ncbi:MAG: Gfo/Idh/MocA family protein [Opitutaceae bacterium]
MSRSLKVGLVGCGIIARNAYLPFSNDSQTAYEIVACCDSRVEVAEQLAKDFNIPKVYPTVEELLADPSIDVVLNLTHPAGHAPINILGLKAGKHVYCEKPFALTVEEGAEVLKVAKEAGLAVGCAPDTVLGAGTQTIRKLIDDGAIGRPLSARVHMACPGHEHWHANPEFYYKPGGGPLLDMGPYYLSFLVQVFGPIKSVQGRVVRGFDERPIRCEPLKGQMMQVETPTLYTGSIETESGVIVQALFSFDHCYGQQSDNIPEVFGTEGALRGTDPNCFDQVPQLNKEYAGNEFTDQEIPFTYTGGRGLGLVDMVESIGEGRAPRCSGAIAQHVLEVMLAFHESERIGGTVEIESTCEKPLAMPVDGLAGLKRS